MLKQTQRYYEAKFITTPEQRKILESTYAFFNKAYAGTADLFLTMLASVNPDTHDRIGRTDIPEKELFCFLMWFSLESDKGQEFKINKEELVNKFHEHWFNCTDVAPDTSVISLIPQMQNKDGTVWVDRRTMFGHFNQNLLLNQNDIVKLFSAKLLPLFKSGDPSIQFWRSFISINWGEGEKSDWEGKHALYVGIDEVWDRIYVENNPGHTAENILKFAQVESVTELKKKLSLRGLDDSFIQFLKEPKDSKLPKLREILREKIALAKERLDHYSPNFIVGFRKCLSQIVGFDVEGYLEVYCEVMSKAWERLISTRSSQWNRIVDFVATFKSMLAIDAKKEYLDAICLYESTMKEKVGTKDYRFKKNHIQGFECFLDIVNGYSAYDFDECYNQAKTAYDGRIGQRELFKILVDDELTDIAEIKKATDVKCLDLKLASSYLGAFRHIDDESPMRIHFGVSRPAIIFGEVSENNIQTKIWTFDGNQFALNDFNIASKRFVREIYYNPNTDIVAPRNDNLTRLFHDIPNDVLPCNSSSIGKNGTNIGAGLFYRKGRGWYLSLSPKIQYEFKPKFRMETGDTILSVDLGIRYPVAYSVLKLGDDGEIRLTYSPKNEKQKGKSIQVEEITKGIADIEVLEELGRWATADEMVFAQSVFSLREKTLDVQEYKFIKLMQITSIQLLRHIKQGNANAATKIALVALTKLLSPKFLKLKIDDHNANSGGLTIMRIDVYRNLYKACMSFYDQSPDELIQQIAKLALNKFENMRRERVRLIANCILGLAYEHDVQWIILEEFEDNLLNKQNTKELNRKVDGWYAHRIVKYVSDNAMLYNINVATVNRANTSHFDPYTSSPICRRYRVDLREDNKHWKKRIDSMKKVKGLYGENMRALLGHFNSSNFDELVDNAMDKGYNDLYIPWHGGDHVISRDQPMLSDVLAAVNIGCCGIKMKAADSIKKAG